ncbi:sensor histidine kinase [Alkalihalobacterium elongatum]|uniref:sensor histidine kinase n=1 Tax=Alkalihalobacterium elongatum TaxID=2675466 RepID=UPI001C1F8DDC|nr:histidine kinase [Alkalihalobacterium elongatum]
MGKKIFVVIFIMLLLPFYTVQAKDVSVSTFLNISISNEDGTIEQIRNRENWKPLNDYQLVTDKVVWLKIDVSKDSSKDPYLYLNISPSYFEVYQKQSLIYTYGDLEPDPRIIHNRRWDLFPIDANETVYIRLKGNLPETMMVGPKDQFLKQMIFADLYRIIGNLAFGLMAVFSLIFYLFNRTQTLLLTFAGFALSLAVGGILRVESKQFLFEEPLIFIYFNAFVSTVGPVLFIMFFSHLLDERYKKLASWTWKFYGGFCIIVILTLTFWPQLFVVGVVSLNVLLVVSMLAISIFMILSYVKTKKRELLFSILGVVGFITIYLIGSVFKIAETGIDVGLIANYVLASACISIIISQYVELQRNVQRYSDELEIKVQERTTKLKETHQQLVKSIQESSAAMAEIAALEERNRITQEIHDNVGHTLTATILQIEASKRLLDKNKDVAKEKMEIAQDLVRKGLDEIRSSVRMLKANEWNFDLKTSLLELIEETCKYTEVNINAEIEDVPSMTQEQKSTVYLSLKEGLTNGIKHGHCEKFHFQLSVEKNTIRFLLKNDGKPLDPQKYGFGLSAMNERIQQLNGKLRVYSEKEWGCVLNISFPHKDKEI